MGEATTQQQELVKVPRKITRDLPVKLTQDELAGVAKDIGRLNRERVKMEGEAKASAAQWKDRISGLDAQIADLADLADSGQRALPVACEERHDYRRGEVQVVRLDTGELLEARPMTPAERQATLPLEQAPAAPAADAGGAPAGDDAQAAAPLQGEDDGVPITDPQGVLGDDGGDEPKKRRGRKGEG